MVKAPQVCGLVLCQGLRVDPATRLLSLEGVFLHREFRKFPTALVPFTAYAALFDGRGEGELSLTCTRLEGEQTYYSHKRWQAFAAAGQTIHMEIRIRKLWFPAPGRYALTLSFDQYPLTVRYLDIRRNTHGPAR
jgi:hypothetical protein